MNAVPITVALAAGGLATLNPCGFSLLPALLSFQVGAREERLPRTGTRIGQGLLAGTMVAVGFLSVFAALALPVSYGARLVADAIPWVGVALGIALMATGAVALVGKHLRVASVERYHAGRGRDLAPMFAFGMGYGLASLGCTLPLFLSLVSATLDTEGWDGSLVVFAAYAAGMTAVLTALTLGAALIRDGVSRRLRRLLPHVNRLSGGLLVLAGSYQAYYWARLQLGPSATIADDPIVGPVTRYTARLEVIAERHGLTLVLVAAVVIAIAAIPGLRRAVRLVRDRRSRWTRHVTRAALILALAPALITLVSGCSKSEVPVTAGGRLQDLHDVDQLRMLFNDNAGKPRLILLLSPTCPTCQVGASWVQQHVLTNYPDARLAVLVVWMPQYPGDSRSRWDPQLLTDRRVTHLWDQDSRSGRWFREHVKLPYQTGPVLWDAYLLYGPQAQWSDVPNGLISTGRPVIGNSTQLEHDIQPLLSR